MLSDCRKQRSLDSFNHLIQIDVQQSKSVGESGSLFPSGDDDDRITRVDETASLSEIDTKLDASINILQPIGDARFYQSKG